MYSVCLNAEVLIIQRKKKKIKLLHQPNISEKIRVTDRRMPNPSFFPEPNCQGHHKNTKRLSTHCNKPS